MSTPETRLWNSFRKSAPKKTFALRVENRSGPGTPDVAVVWDFGTVWLELKAPKTQPAILKENTAIRPHLFGFSEECWGDAMLKGLTSQNLMDSSQNLMGHQFSLSFTNPKYVRQAQKAWHAKAFASGAATFFLEKAQGPSFFRLFSPYLDPASAALRLGLVCESRDPSLIWYALRRSSELHCLAALRR